MCTGGDNIHPLILLVTKKMLLLRKLICEGKKREGNNRMDTRGKSRLRKVN